MTHDDVHGTAAVVLDDLVSSLVGTSTDDPSLITRSIVLDSDSIFADYKASAKQLGNIYRGRSPSSNQTNSRVQAPSQ
jgi:hypothetical protein